MAKDPAVLLYTQDFLVGTITMSYEQRGKYITLLCLQHQKGKLTLKDLQAILTDEDYEIAEKFPKQPDGFYYNQRMFDEAIKRKNYSESRKRNLMGKHKKSHMNSHLENENEDVNAVATGNAKMKIVSENASAAKLSKQEIENFFDDVK
jgi:uncharacterized protein YdaU (DUF1376 family)